MPGTLLFSHFHPTTVLSRRVADALCVVAGSLAVAALSQIAIPLPFTPIPITAQTLGVLLVGALLGARRGSASLGLYLAEGSAGLPFFAGGQAGIAHLMGPRGGYLFGFVAAAYLIGYLAERGYDRKLGTAVLAFLGAQTVIFALGATWLGLFVGYEHALVAGVLPFIPGELIKTIIASAILSGAWKKARL